jgi:hypothetical protein
LDVDDQQCLVQPAFEPVALSGQLRDVQRLGAQRAGLGAAPLRRQCGLVGRLALAPPGAQRRRVHAFAAHQRADLCGQRAAVGGVQDAALVGRRELAAPRAGNDFAVGAGPQTGRRRAGRISSRPAGSLRCARRGESINLGHRCLVLLCICHTYLFAH